MRQKRTVQSSIFDLFCAHELGEELRAMSRWLDDRPEVVTWVAQDLQPRRVQATGRCGLSAETVLRCALLKQHRDLSYEELAFHLADSHSFQAFARLPLHVWPKRSVLQKTISAIKSSTWERINRCLLSEARHRRIERGERVRVDSTVTDSLIHPPTDSSLLWDAMRVQWRLLQTALRLPGAPQLQFKDHRRIAKRRAHRIQYSRGRARKERLYRDLVAVTRKTASYLEDAQQALLKAGVSGTQFKAWCSQVAHYKPLIGRLIDQTCRRVFDGERVPATEKIVSLFEPHTAIIVKGGRDTQYGHKLNLNMGRSGLILDLVIERANPADSERLVPMLDRHIEIYGRAPRQLAADGGYASKNNLEQAKERGVEDVAFHRKAGLSVSDMVKSHRVYRQLRNFRAGIEAGISHLKRSYGLSRCTWRGLDHFHSYVWSSVVAYNLCRLARLHPS